MITVEDEDAFQFQGLLAQQEGLLVGPSAGANIFSAVKLAHRLGKGKTVVTILPDTGERYLSTGDGELSPWWYRYLNSNRRLATPG